MINRILIRIKLIQIVYSYYLNTKKDLSTVEKELFFSLEKAYELYILLLLLPIEITELQRRKLDAGRHKLLPTQEDLAPNTKFIDNKYVVRLSENSQLKKIVATQKISWTNDADFVKRLSETILASDMYADYMNASDNSFEADHEFWKNVFKTFICDNEDLEQVLEDSSVYWNDDLEIVSTFALKTMKRFNKYSGIDENLLPMFKADEDARFAEELLRRTIIYQSEYNDLVQKQAKNWEFERIAFMDSIIMQAALAELTSFPTIPVKVTLNEYIEIAKHYSTEKSGTFINGILDGIVASLKKENKLLKN